MANFIRTNFLVQPSTGDTAVFFKDKNGNIVHEIFVKTITAIWHDGPTVKIKKDSSSKPTILDFSTSQEASVALQIANKAIEDIKATLPSGDINQDIIDYIDLRFSQSSFQYHQLTPITNWLITHNLDKFPSVTVTDNSLYEIEGLVRYLDSNTVMVLFNQAVEGWVYIN
jgi:hypothetical protein